MLHLQSPRVAQHSDHSRASRRHQNPKDVLVPDHRRCPNFRLVSSQSVFPPGPTGPASPPTPSTPVPSPSTDPSPPEKPSKLKPRPKPKLEDINLSHILNGETCSPLAFSDFASYLAKKEMTLENLLFVLWYRSYTYRWNELGEETRGVPRPSTRLGDRHDPFGSISDSSASSSDMEAIAQPMREEAQRAYATFLLSGGSRELNCSDELGQYVARCLKKSTAPELFQPVYEEICMVLGTQSVPRFVELARYNVNWKKQGFWWFLGAFDLTCGIILYILLTLFLHPTHYSYRAIRLPSGIFIWFGSGSLYSAYRGFCSHVWGRSSAQIKPWELDGYERVRKGHEVVLDTEGKSPREQHPRQSGIRPSPLVHDSTESFGFMGNGEAIGTARLRESGEEEMRVSI